MTALAVLAVAATGANSGAGKTHAVVKPHAELKWVDSGIAGVSSAVVEGDMTKGASRFYLKYAAGFVTPPHHHSPDHFVTTVSGTLVLTVDGKEHRLPPGSYFAFTEKAAHVARCEEGEDCVMFIDSRGPWDVVLEGKGSEKP
jgi:quercetin dioxygenase-like cupin family protein